MAGSGWNPIRRNRNIGTSKQGHGSDNRLVIPNGWPDDRVCWEVLNKPITMRRFIGRNAITFLVEPTSRGCVYPCSIDDIAAMLKLVPAEHLDGLELIILRQPTKKQSIVSSVWGRFLYYAEPGPLAGSAICIEAQDLSEKMTWGKSLTPDDKKELKRLEADGNVIRSERRGYEIQRTAESIRNTVLFRTLLHEIGHYVDWLESVILPSIELDDPVEENRIAERFNSKPSKDKEDFAHRYADNLSSDLKSSGMIPFPPIGLTEQMRTDGVKPDWFAHRAVED